MAWKSSGQSELVSYPDSAVISCVTLDRSLTLGECLCMTRSI